MNERKPRMRFVVGNHVVCIHTGQTGQILAITPGRGACIVRTARSSQLLTVNEADLRFANWDEVRAAGDPVPDQAESGRNSSTA